MMFALFAVSLLSSAVTADSIASLYAQKDVAALETVCQEPPSRELGLLCAYRLYPLTQKADLLSDLPTSLENASAREYALLSGLWGYRTSGASFTQMMRFGRIAESTLQSAIGLDPNDPFVLLVEGQSLMFKPRIVGGDRRRALERFELLKSALETADVSGIDLMEARVWVWYASDRLGRADADDVRTSLLASNPAPVYREFLMSPP